MQSSIVFHSPFKVRLEAMIYALGLAIGSFLIWGACLDRQPTPVGPGLRLAALGLVVMWTHFLVWLVRGMSRREMSVGYCIVLFFGAWALFFLVYNCLL